MNRILQSIATSKPFITSNHFTCLTLHREWIAPLVDVVAVGDEGRESPGGSPAYHAYVRCQSAWSEPMTKTSRCPASHVLAAGPVVAVSFPPRDSHADQTLLLNDRCQSAVSLPRPKTSMRAPLQETAAGVAVSCPRWEYQSDQALLL